MCIGLYVWVKVLGPLKLELQTVMSCHMGSRKTVSAQLLSHLSSPARLLDTASSGKRPLLQYKVVSN